MKTLRLFAAAALVLTGCVNNFSGPRERDCRWRYTKFALRTDTVPNQIGPGAIIVTHEMPVDSVQECRPKYAG